MKRISRTIIISMLFMALASCNNFAPQPTETPTSTETSLPTPTNSHQPTHTPTGTPISLPSSTESFGFKRVSINYFIPNLSFEVPISFEIPQDYVWCQTSDDHNTYFWTAQKCGSFSPPKATSYFQARLAHSTYDSQTARFSNLPNDINDIEIISLFEDAGAKLNRVERKYIGEFPILIIELEWSYEEMPGIVKTQSVNRIFVATLVDNQVLWIDYYFSMPTNFEEESAIWERFEYSLERNP